MVSVETKKSLVYEMRSPIIAMYSTPKALWLLPASLGSMVIFVAVGKLLRYMRDVMSANIYETGIIYDYPEDFDEDDHTHLSVECWPEAKEQHGAEKGQQKGEGRFKGIQPGTNRENMHRQLELDSLRHFVRRKVIPYFQNQRDSVNGGDHFAVLILLEGSLASLSTGDWEAFKPLMDTGTPHVDSRHRTRPPRNMYDNYVVARPQLHRVSKVLRQILFHRVPEVFYEHAEVMLLNEFDTLCEVFEEHHGCEAKVIILFSWLFPCSRCTSELVHKFGHEFRTEHPAVQRVVVVFAVYWCRMPFEENWENFKRLRDGGLDVVRVNSKRS